MAYMINNDRSATALRFLFASARGHSRAELSTSFVDSVRPSNAAAIGSGNPLSLRRGVNIKAFGISPATRRRADCDGCGRRQPDNYR